MVNIVCSILLFLCLFTNVSAQQEAFDTVCPQLSAPDHGSINATDGNNLYSKVTYSCDSGYSIQGPPTRQCLPVPVPNTAFWIPQEVTTCVQGLFEEEYREPLLIYDPAEDEILSNDDFHQSSEAESISYVEDISDVEDTTADERVTEPAIPPSLIALSADDEEQELVHVQQPRSNDAVADELCTAVAIPQRYQCRDTALTSSFRWKVDRELGDCVVIDLCGEDDEISIMGLFHTYAECEKRCLS